MLGKGACLTKDLAFTNMMISLIVWTAHDVNFLTCKRNKYLALIISKRSEFLAWVIDFNVIRGNQNVVIPSINEIN